MSEPPAASQRGRQRTLSTTMLHQDLNLLKTYAKRYGASPERGRSGSRGHGRNSSRGNPSRGNSHRSISPLGSDGRVEPPPRGGTGRTHERRPSNLISANNHSTWGADSIESLQSEMEAAMAGMLYQYTKRVNQEMQFYDELEAIATANPEFCNPQRALSWTIKEVCWWLIQLHLEKYAKSFHELGIDGNILLYDVDHDILEREVGIRPLHMRKLMRELLKLRKMNNIEADAGGATMSSSASESELVGALRAELDEQRKVNHDLRQQLLQHRASARSNRTS